MFTINSTIFRTNYKATYDTEIAIISNNLKYTRNKVYFIDQSKRHILQKINNLNSESRGLAQFISQVKNELELDKRKKSIDIVKEYCLANKYDLELAIKQIAQILALYKVYDAISDINYNGSITNKKQETEIIKSINISPEIISEFHKELEVFFNESERDSLLNLLNGNLIESRLTINLNSNRFVELIRRMEYNGFINETKTNIQSWIINNFRYRKESNKEISDFKPSTVHDILCGVDKAQPKKDKRILNLEWLPYKS
jgi:hypothetical protein